MNNNDDGDVDNNINATTFDIANIVATFSHIVFVISFCVCMLF